MSTKKYYWKEKECYIERDRVLSPQETRQLLESDYYGKEKGKESDFEEKVYSCLVEICYGLSLAPLTDIKRQKLYLYDGYRIKPDLITFHTDNSITVFEIKKANDKHPCTGTTNQLNAVGQLFLYKSILQARNPKKKIRLAIVDNKIYKRTMYAIADSRLPITLIEVQKDRVFVPYYAWGDSYG